MTSHRSVLKQGLGLASALALLSLTTGCANMIGTTAADDSATPFALSGTVHGGNQVLTSLTVTVWAAGNTGYGSKATALASTTSNATTGAFSIGTYTCPTSSNTTESQYVYITAQGGSSANVGSNVVLVAALGLCSAVTTNYPHIDIDEASTIAAMFALEQFFSPGNPGGVTGTTMGNIGTSSTNITGLANAFGTAENLLSLVNNASNVSTSPAVMINGTSTTVTITPEYSKLNLEANILAACVQGVSGACTTLLQDTGPATTSANDTMQAAYYLATNPTSTTTATSTSNIAALFLLAGSPAPYPSTTTQPTDWTLGITYGTKSNNGTTYFMNKPYFLAVDASGDIWYVNNTSASLTTNNSVSEISPIGTPIAQVLTSNLIGASYITIDPSGNVWVPNYSSASGSGTGTSVAEYPTTGTAASFTTGTGPQKVVSDGAGNIFAFDPSYKNGSGELDEIPSGAAASSTAAVIATGLDSDFSNIAIDGNSAIWITGGGTLAIGSGTAAAGEDALYQFLPNATTVTIAAPSGGTSPVQATAVPTITGGVVKAITVVNGGAGYSSATPPTVTIAGAGSNATATATVSAAGAVTGFTIGAGGTGYTTYPTAPNNTTITGGVSAPENALAITSNNDVWVVNYGKETLSELSGVNELAGTPSITSLQSTAFTAPSTLAAPEFAATDGLGNVWVTDAATAGSVFEFSGTGTSLSPSGFAHTYYFPYGIAIDASGNVWIGSEETSTSTFTAFITEIVGAAAPVVTPIAAGLPATVGGTSKLGTRP